jgi:nucleoside-diphosphate-sugar epimerase
MRILVTGASGFVGAHLMARLFGDGHELRVLPSPQFRAERLAGIGYQVVGEPAEARAELVYHLASTPLQESISAHTHERVIVGGTRRLLEELRPHRPLRVVMTGSAAEYGSGHGWREDDAPRPDTMFGRLKREAEEMVRASGLASVHLRVFTPFGEGEAPGRLVPSVTRAALSGGPVRLATDGEQTRDWFHVSDLIEALVEAGRRPLEPGVAINICSGVARRVIDVARRIVELAGTGLAVEPGEVPAAVLERSSGNGERAARLLGWRPRVELDEGLMRAMQL